MNDSLEALNSSLETEKEILEVMPKNTKKNLNLYKEKVSELKEMYTGYLNNVILEMKRRVNRINHIEQNSEIEVKQKELEEFRKLDLFWKIHTPFEAMELEPKLYQLRRFYKGNLENVNKNIAECIQSFEQMGIQLTEENFNYCPYVKKYMTEFFKEYRNGDINSQELRSTFEKIYWECSDLIMHIKLNIRYLYFENEKEIEKNLHTKRKEMLRQLKTSEEEYIEKYKQLEIDLDELISSDRRNILDKFMNKEIDVKDYEDTAVVKQYEKMLYEPIGIYSGTELKELNEHILKLAKSIEEYTNYSKYKFIIDKVIKAYDEREKYKNVYDSQKKTIQKLEAKLKQSNKKYEKLYKHKESVFFGKKNEEKLKDISSSINSQILELREFYRELDINKVNEKIAEALTDNSTIYDALLLASAYYTFLVENITDNDKEISEDEANQQIKELRSFVLSPYISVINNVTIKEEKDIVLMIRDMYSLFNIKIAKEDFEEGSIENLKQILNIIVNKYYLEKSKLDLDDISYVMKANPLLEEIG